MKSVLDRILSFVLVRIIGRDRVRKLLIAAAQTAGLDLLTTAYNSMGILKCNNEGESGERFLIAKVLKRHITWPRPVLVDVGANIGKYSLMLAEEFPDAVIYSFEPNRNAFDALRANLGGKAVCVNAGLGSTNQKEGTLYTYPDNLSSSHASIHKQVFTFGHRAERVTTLSCEMTTLHDFCRGQKITEIDFLKIDTEGNELDVLKGCRELLTENHIKIIQFEFGECDIFSRVFLHDFYRILGNYRIYRLDSDSLIPLFEYETYNEIFRFQNLVAVHYTVSLDSGIEPRHPGRQERVH